MRVCARVSLSLSLLLSLSLYCCLSLSLSFFLSLSVCVPLPLWLCDSQVMIGVVERCVPWMQDKIAAEVRRQLQREVPAALQEDSRMQKLQEAMLSRVEDRVHQVSQKVLDQLVQENRYQHINAALLRDLQVRGDAILEHNEQGLIKLHGQHQVCALPSLSWNGTGQNIPEHSASTRVLAVFGMR